MSRKQHFILLGSGFISHTAATELSYTPRNVLSYFLFVLLRNNLSSSSIIEQTNSAMMSSKPPVIIYRTKVQQVEQLNFHILLLQQQKLIGKKKKLVNINIYTLVGIIQHRLVSKISTTNWGMTIKGN